MRVFVTGSKGFVGKELVSQCEKQGIEVIGVDLPEADVCSKEISELIPDGIDAIINLAALSKDPDCKNRAYECFRSNVMGTLNLIDVAEKKKAKQFIFASSEWVYDNCTDEETKDEGSFINIANHTSEYALSKLVSEANLRQKYQHGFCPVTILRFGIVYGNRKMGASAIESIFQSVRHQDAVEVGSLETGRHFIHVSDIIKGIISSIGIDGLETININGSKLITLSDIIIASMDILQKHPSIIEKDSDSKNVRRISSKKAEYVLGWKAEVGLEAGLNILNSLVPSQEHE